MSVRAVAKSAKTLIGYTFLPAYRVGCGVEYAWSIASFPK